MSFLHPVSLVSSFYQGVRAIPQVNIKKTCLVAASTLGAIVAGVELFSGAPVRALLYSCCSLGCYSGYQAECRIELYERHESFLRRSEVAARQLEVAVGRIEAFASEIEQGSNGRSWTTLLQTLSETLQQTVTSLQTLNLHSYLTRAQTAQQNFERTTRQLSEVRKEFQEERKAFTIERLKWQQLFARLLPTTLVQ